MMFLRACSLSSGATASSTSRNTMSAALRAAFSNMPGLDPGTASSDRCSRGVACSMMVKLTLFSFANRSTRCPKPGRRAIDRQQQRIANLLVAAGAELTQQADLLAADLIQG